ncbi:hypothetical protein [Pseudoclavibacter chungangensis]|uniref:hypothetical protein n=1 Tax=Pseudoclavibacter chungangensis TaxID=587635 RepID=UPI0015CBDE16|nr:hypothetical protein [Pseudoclavibacter chungangensis]
MLLDLQEGGYYDVKCTRSVLAAMDALELGLRLQLEQTADLEHGRPDPARPGEPTTRSRDDADPFDGILSSPDADAPGLDADAASASDAGAELDAELDAQLASMESDEREPDGAP